MLRQARRTTHVRGALRPQFGDGVRGSVVFAGVLQRLGWIILKRVFRLIDGQSVRLSGQVTAISDPGIGDTVSTLPAYQPRQRLAAPCLPALSMLDGDFSPKLKPESKLALDDAEWASSTGREPWPCERHEVGEGCARLNACLYRYHTSGGYKIYQRGKTPLQCRDDRSHLQSRDRRSRPGQVATESGRMPAGPSDPTRTESWPSPSMTQRSALLIESRRLYYQRSDITSTSSRPGRTSESRAVAVRGSR